jgi:chromosome partitioning protein
MLMQASARRSASAHVIVVGNEKGGTGKSTVAMHLAIALMNLGQRVATIDVDSRQKTLTHYIENRRAWAKRGDIHLKIPEHFCVVRGSTRKLEENEAIEFTGMVDSIAASERTQDFIVIDLAGADNHLTRLAHSMADTLVTPLNDSHIDLDVLGTVDPVSYAITGENQYSHMVREARVQRRMVDDTRMDWVVISNRVSLLGSPNRERINKAVHELSSRIGFRTADGLAERVIYREFFPRGLTAVDSLDEKTLGARPRLSHVAARQEVMNLIESLKLRLDERGQQRAAAHAEWVTAQATPLEVPDFIVDEA